MVAVERKSIMFFQNWGWSLRPRVDVDSVSGGAKANSVLGDAEVGSVVELPNRPGSRSDQVRVISHDDGGKNTTVLVLRAGDTHNLTTEKDGIELKLSSSEPCAKRFDSSGSSSGSSDFGVARGDSMAHSSFESAKASGDFTGSRGSWESYKAADEVSKRSEW